MVRRGPGKHEIRFQVSFFARMLRDEFCSTLVLWSFANFYHLCSFLSYVTWFHPGIYLFHSHLRYRHLNRTPVSRSSFTILRYVYLYSSFLYVVRFYLFIYSFSSHFYLPFLLISFKYLLVFLRFRSKQWVDSEQYQSIKFYSTPRQAFISRQHGAINCNSMISSNVERHASLSTVHRLIHFHFRQRTSSSKLSTLFLATNILRKSVRVYRTV